MSLVSTDSRLQKSAAHPLSDVLDNDGGEQSSAPVVRRGVNRFDADKLKAAIDKVKNPNRHTGFSLKPTGETRQEFQVKQSDSWLQRWLALHAARDAANMQNPAVDAAASKLGGPLSLGLSEAVSNLAMGDTRQERKETLQDAVSDVEHDSYGKTALRGLKTSLPYVLAGGAGGVAHSALLPWTGKPEWRPGAALREGAIGSGLGLSLAVLRPLLQKLVLENVSDRAKRKAIAIKADMPMTTALPMGDMLAAGLHKQANARRHAPIFRQIPVRPSVQEKPVPVVAPKQEPVVAPKQEPVVAPKQEPVVAPPSDAKSYLPERPEPKLPSREEVEPATNALARALNSEPVKALAQRIGFDGSLSIGNGTKLKIRPWSFSLSHRF